MSQKSSVRQLPQFVPGTLMSDSAYYLSKAGLDGHRYRIGHPLAQYALTGAASRELRGAEIIFDYSAWPQKAVSIEPYIGKEGTLTAHKLSVRGADDQDHIILVAVTDDGKQMDQKTAMRLFDLPARRNGPAGIGLSESIRKTIESRRKAILNELAERQAAWFDDEMEKLDHWADDKRAGLKADLKELDDQIKELKKEVRQTGNLPDKLALRRKVKVLEAKRDEAWRGYDVAAKEIEVEKDGLLDQVEERLGQEVSEEELFTIRFEIK